MSVNNRHVFSATAAMVLSTIAILDARAVAYSIQPQQQVAQNDQGNRSNANPGASSDTNPSEKPNPADLRDCKTADCAAAPPLAQPEAGASVEQVKSAFDKAVSILSKALAPTSLRLDRVGRDWRRVNEIKTCNDAANTDTKSINRDKKTVPLYIIRVTGEVSGTQLIIGKSCNSTIKLDARTTVVLSFLVEQSTKEIKNKDTLYSWIVPISRQLPSDPELYTLQYKTEKGSVVIQRGKDNYFEAKMKSDDGSTIYAESFQLK